jgi:hypothetical protein
MFDESTLFSERLTAWLRVSESVERPGGVA